MLTQVFPHWDQLLKFVAGQIEALDFQRQVEPKRAASIGGNGLQRRRMA